jgi:uncharacterized protein
MSASVSASPLLHRHTTHEEQRYLQPHYDAEVRICRRPSKLAVVVAHPWGPLGGNLHNPLVRAVVLYFQRWNVTTVRYNLASCQIGWGHRQVKQTVDLVESIMNGGHDLMEIEAGSPAAARAPPPPPPQYIMLVGYSYGALVVASAAADLAHVVVGVVQIAPPWGVQHWLFMFAHHHHERRANSSTIRRRLCIQGQVDNFTSESVFMRQVQQASVTGAVVKDADHFFARREKDVLDIVGEWLLRQDQSRSDLSTLAQWEWK